MKHDLYRYGFSDAAVDAVAPVVDALAHSGARKATRILATFTIEWCRRIDSKALLPKEVDEYFTLLDLYLGEHGGEIQLGEDAQQLVVEGMTLHHLGGPASTDLATLQGLATKLLMS